MKKRKKSRSGSMKMGKVKGKAYAFEYGGQRKSDKIAYDGTC